MAAIAGACVSAWSCVRGCWGYRYVGTPAGTLVCSFSRSYCAKPGGSAPCQDTHARRFNSALLTYLHLEMHGQYIYNVNSNARGEAQIHTMSSS